MPMTELTSPLIISGSSNGTTSEQDAPSLFNEGTALFDARYTYKRGAGAENKALIALGIGPSLNILVVDQVPSAISNVNIAAGQFPVSGTGMALVNGTGGIGITKLAAALTIPQTGNVVPSGALVIDATPGIVLYGTQQSVGLADPTKSVTRAISFTGVSGGTGGTVKIVGCDIWGNLIHETLTVTSGATTSVSKKMYKFIISLTPQFSDGTHNLSAGTADTFGFPIRVDTFGYARIFWSATVENSSVGFTGAVSTTATATSADVRGSYALQSDASDGTKRMTIFVSVSAANITTTNGLFGVAQFVG